MRPREARLSRCLQIIEETGEIEPCVALYPDLESELRQYGGTLSTLASAAPSQSSAAAQSVSRQTTFSVLAQPPVNTTSTGNFVRRAIGGFAVLALLLAGAAGATAATPGGISEMGPVSEVLAAVGIIERKDSGESPPSQQGVEPAGGESGRGVSGDIHEAIETTEPGSERGIAVSEAACEAAHDSGRLPEKAAAAKAGQDKEARHCTHPNADATPGNGNSNGPKPEKQPPEKQPPEKQPKEPGKPGETPGAGNQGGGPPGGEPPGKSKKP